MLTPSLSFNSEDDNKLPSESIQDPLFAYFNVFDGSKKSIQDIQSQFDNLFSPNMIHFTENYGNNNNSKKNLPILQRDEFLCLNEYLLEQRMIATLEDVYFRDETHVEYTVHWGNGNGVSVVTHAVGLVADGKIIKVEPCCETRSVFANILQEVARKNHNNNYDEKGDGVSATLLEHCSNEVEGSTEHPWRRAMRNAIVRNFARPATSRE